VVARVRGKILEGGGHVLKVCGPWLWTSESRSAEEDSRSAKMFLLQRYEAAKLPRMVEKGIQAGTWSVECGVWSVECGRTGRCVASERVTAIRGGGDMVKR
jgi:hypothetical protein